MDIHISGQGCKIGDSLKQHIEESIEQHVHKYFQHAVSAKIVLSNEAKHKLFHAEVLVNEGVSHGPIIKGSASNFDAYIAVDEAIAKITNTLRRYKRKIKAHHSPERANLKSYLFSRYDDYQEIKPVIIEEQVMDIKHLSIEDAIMHLEFMALPALIFINIETSKLNIIYPKDGHIILVDTMQALTAAK